MDLPKLQFAKATDSLYARVGRERMVFPLSRLLAPKCADRYSRGRRPAGDDPTPLGPVVCQTLERVAAACLRNTLLVIRFPQNNGGSDYGNISLDRDASRHRGMGQGIGSLLGITTAIGIAWWVTLPSQSLNLALILDVVSAFPA
ncbi:MAG: hypothetical protein JWQ10_656 [Herbaspirillum sp.]|nr:hypothetical protein [Herbaspirillum sp.]